MEGSLFPNRSVLPMQPNRPTHPKSTLKFSSTLFLPPTPPPQSPSPSSFHLDLLLQHLQHLSANPIITNKLKLSSSARDGNAPFVSLHVPLDSAEISQQTQKKKPNSASSVWRVDHHETEFSTESDSTLEFSSPKGFTPCVTTYNALLNALACRGDWKAAESVILDMGNKGFKPECSMCVYAAFYGFSFHKVLPRQLLPSRFSSILEKETLTEKQSITRSKNS